MQERLTDLEIRYAHLERLVHQLSDIVREQADELDRLARRLELAEKLSRAAAEDGEARPPHERPPHY